MELPRVLKLLRSEVTAGTIADWPRFKRTLSDKGFLRDLRQQAEASVPDAAYPKSAAQAGSADVGLYGPTSLNPFTAAFKCADFECRVKCADATATLSSLYTDYLVVTDEFARLFDGEGQLDASQLRGLGSALTIADRLSPQLEAGIIRFAKPPESFCPSCAARVHPEINAIADTMWTLFLKEGSARFARTIGQGELEWWTPSHDGLISTVKLDRKQLRLVTRLADRHTGAIPSASLEELHSILRPELVHEVQEALEHAAVAAEHGLTGASASTREALAVQLASPDRQQIEKVTEWRAAHSLDLPWIRDLSPAQALELRMRASKALPSFRALVSARISSGIISDTPRQSVVDLVGELRQDAERVRTELESIAREHPQALGAIGTIATVGMALTTVATMNPLAGAATLGLASVVAGLHPRAADAEHQRMRAVASPGYVLVAASEVLRHAREQHAEPS